MDFGDHMLPVSKTSVFELEGFFVWCGSAVKADDGRYYLYFSFWPKPKGFEAWVTHSAIGFAVSDSPTGPYRYGGIALAGGAGGAWDRDVAHNPSVIRHEGVYYLYYVGNHGNGEYWDHRNRQRVGVAWSKRPEGPFVRLDHPLIDVTPGGHDAIVTSNPTVSPDGKGGFLMVYKAVGLEKPLPVGGPVVCGVAFSKHPLGPFVKRDRPIMVNPDHVWSVEDPYIWRQDGRYFALVKDFQGYFTKSGKPDVALFVSHDGFDWEPHPEHPLAFPLQIVWVDGETRAVHRLERPQLLLDGAGKPIALFCACMETSGGEHSCNVHIPLRF